MTPPRRALAAAAAVLLAATLGGCATTVSMEPADDANDAACAAINVRLPENLVGQERRHTDAQSTGAWGDPAAILYSCGVEPPGPTEQQCITLGGVDWIVDQSEAPRYRVTSYGRVPAVEVYIDNETVSPNDVLAALGSIVNLQVPATGACISTETLLP
jgi:hypothetical protein